MILRLIYALNRTCHCQKFNILNQLANLYSFHFIEYAEKFLRFKYKDLNLLVKILFWSIENDVALVAGSQPCDATCDAAYMILYSLVILREFKIFQWIHWLKSRYENIRINCINISHFYWYVFHGIQLDTLNIVWYTVFPKLVFCDKCE